MNARTSRASCTPDLLLRLLLGALHLGACVCLTAGCSGKEGKISAGGAAGAGIRSVVVGREECSVTSNRVEQLDVNNDGKPDIKKVMGSDGREICRITQLSGDGRPTMIEFFDSNGVIRRREADYDMNGRVDSVEFFEQGKLVRSELDTTGRNRIDTWDFFDPATGKRTRRERAQNLNGRIDQWWTWEGDKLTIAVDSDGDGKPDPAATIASGGRESRESSPANSVLDGGVDSGMASSVDGGVR